MVRLLNSFTLVCKEYNPYNKFVWDTSTCVCDFRVNIHGCPEQEIHTIANWVLITYCSLLILVASICLYHLIYVKKQSFFLPARKDRGFLRPRPQHMCYALALMYCPWQIIHALQLINDLYPNVASVEVFQALSRTLTASFLVLYPLSILYSTGVVEILSSVESISEMERSRNLLKMDIICFSIMLSPLIIFLPLAGLSGHYADIGEIEKAKKYFIVQNICWVIWGSFYLGTVIYFWSRFIPRILEKIESLTKNPELKSKLDQFRQDRDDITISTLWQMIPACLYLLILFLYGVFHRSNTIFIYGINLVYLINWQYGIPILIHIIQWVMIYNIHVPSRISPNTLKKNNHNNHQIRSHHNHNRSSIIGIGYGIDRRSNMITLADYHYRATSSDFGKKHYSYSSTNNLINTSRTYS